jgi:Ran GTPase-activating protein (RanGAP) involved in mRNA processing and transport
MFVEFYKNIYINLKNLDFRGNNICEEGMKEICNCLENNEALVALDLR